MRSRWQSRYGTRAILFRIRLPSAEQEQEMDDVYALPYMRAYHPSYEKKTAVCRRLRNQIQSDEQPRLLWILQFLRADRSTRGVVAGSSHESILAEARQMVQKKRI